MQKYNKRYVSQVAESLTFTLLPIPRSDASVGVGEPFLVFFPQACQSSFLLLLLLISSSAPHFFCYPSYWEQPLSFAARQRALFFVVKVGVFFFCSSLHRYFSYDLAFRSNKCMISICKKFQYFFHLNSLSRKDKTSNNCVRRMGCAASKERPSSRKSRSKNQSPKSPADSKRKQLAESSTSDPRRQQKKKLVTPGGSAASNPLTTSFNTTEIFNTSGQKIPHGSPKRPPSAGKESPQSAIRDVPETTEQWVPLHPQAELSTFANATQGLPPAEPSIMAVPSIELTEPRVTSHSVDVHLRGPQASSSTCCR